MTGFSFFLVTELWKKFWPCNSSLSYYWVKTIWYVSSHLYFIVKAVCFWEFDRFCPQKFKCPGVVSSTYRLLSHCYCLATEPFCWPKKSKAVPVFLTCFDTTTFFAKLRTRMTMVSSFSHQNDSGLFTHAHCCSMRKSRTVLVVVLVLESKALY